MRSFARLGATLVVASVAGVVVASAATLGGVDVKQLGAGSAVVASCDGDGVELDYAVVFDDESGAYVVTDVTVSGIDAGCTGAELSVVLAGGDGRLATGGPTTVAAGNTAVRLPLDIQPPASAVTRATVLLSGP